MFPRMQLVAMRVQCDHLHCIALSCKGASLIMSSFADFFFFFLPAVYFCPAWNRAAVPLSTQCTMARNTHRINHRCISTGAFHHHHHHHHNVIQLRRCDKKQKLLWLIEPPPYTHTHTHAAVLWITVIFLRADTAGRLFCLFFSSSYVLLYHQRTCSNPKSCFFRKALSAHSVFHARTHSC